MSQETPMTTVGLSTMTGLTTAQHKLSASPSRPTHTLSPIPLHSNRAGSRSPTSIPSSPTSIRSASSAIFERDIEPLVLPHAHHLNPHRTPRSTQMEHSVPSVLTEAAAALASIETGQTIAEGISILTPQTQSPPYGSALGMGLPISPNGQGGPSFGFGGPGSTGFRTPAGVGSQSRSPSPSRATSTLPSPGPTSATSRRTPATSPLPSPLNAASPLPSVPIMSYGVPTPRQHQTSSTPPSSYSPPLAHTSPSLRTSHPPYNDGGHAESPNLLPTSLLHIDPSSLPPPPTRQNLSTAASDPTKRLSFISYSDILYSTPITSLPLSSLTSSATNTPPPHLPAVTNNVPIVLPSPTGGAPSRPLSMYSYTARTGKQSHPSQVQTGEFTYLSDDGSVAGTRRHSVLTQSEDITQRLIDDIGGEWEREGFGKGLEERLEGVTMA
ncbi:hypothetical protein Clacol_007009 [Clathrus columnatus]|uniref:Uncharacterized protein n=1 Tax=Clathrus columnatus TaxID=1419009 RepID=A0AAV5ADR9_9AGAM|nr:hypothetical protein Clacol_007009 [Clathrus columnatus]